MTETVELGPNTIKALAAAIGAAVDEAFDSHFVAPEKAVEIDWITPNVIDDLKQAMHDVLDEREEHTSADADGEDEIGDEATAFIADLDQPRGVE